MLEQKTMQGLTQVAIEWGPIGFGIFAYIAYAFFSHVRFKTKAHSPITKINEEISQLKVDLEKRVEYDDLKEYQRIDVSKVLFEGTNQRLDHIESLLKEVLTLIKK